MDDKGKRERSHTEYISTIPARSTFAKAAESRRVCLLILGMHRSGTSALARVVHILGCDLPKTLMDPSNSNPAGHWESLRVAELNDQILATAGSSWHDWLEFNPAWRRSPKAVEFREKARQILNDEYGSSSFFVLKDPRICRIVPFWLEILEECGIVPLVIFPLRNPIEVAASLEQRDGFDPLFGRLLWLRHVLDAELTSRGLPRVFTSYDSLLRGPYSLAAGMEQRLGMSWPRPVANAAEEIDNFLSERDHRHHTEAPERVLDDPLVPAWLRDTFRILSRWATNGEQPEDFAILDRVRSEFNAAGPAFAQLISASRNAAAKVRTLETSLLEAQTKLSLTEAQLVDSIATIATLEAEAAKPSLTLGAKPGWLSTQSFSAPDFLTDSAWLEHAPFAFWLIESLRPDTIVELGVHHGYSYFCFCQAVQSLGLPSRCYAVDTWKGDEHAGFYGEDVFKSVEEHNLKKYAHFSSLVRSTFDEALPHFSDGSIDLLHIDGRHFYSDVQSDFRAWASKLSEKSVVIFHDTNVRERGFGVYQFWEELRKSYPSFEFVHCHGLGVLGYGSSLPDPLKLLFSATDNPLALSEIRTVYSRLGRALTDRTKLVKHEKALAIIKSKEGAMQASLAERNQKIAELEGVAASTQAQLKVRESELDEVRTNWDGMSASIKSSHELLVASTLEQKTVYAELLRSHQDMARRLEFGAQEILQLTKTLEELKVDAIQTRTEAALLQNVQLELERLKVSYHELEKAKDAAEISNTETGLELETSKHEVDNAHAELQRLQFEMSQLKENWEQLQQQLEAAKAEASKARADAELLPRIKDELDQLKSKNSTLQREASETTCQLQKARTAADTIAAYKRQIESQLEERFREIAALTRLLEQKQKPRKRLHIWLKAFRMAINPFRWSRLKRELMLNREMSKIEQSGRFDAIWYLTSYPDVAAAGVDPLRHYVEFGAAEGRKSNASSILMDGALNH